MRHFLPAVAALALLIGLVGTAAAYAAPSGCERARGSVLAMHSRTLCKSLSRRAAREHPRWPSHVYNECRQVTFTRSWCTWEITWSGHGTSCRGEAIVRGIRRARVSYGEQSCVA